MFLPGLTQLCLEVRWGYQSVTSFGTLVPENGFGETLSPN